MTPTRNRVLVLVVVIVAAVAALAVLAIQALGGQSSRTADDPSPVGSTPTAEAPTPTPTPTPPQLSDYPDETTTGVPPGTELTRSDRLKIDEDGTVIDGLEIRGHVEIHADDVVIRNSRIVMESGKIAVRVLGKNFVMEDSEIDGQGRALPAVAFKNYTLRRVHIHNVAEGPRVSGKGNVTIEDSYIHEMVQRGDNHADIIQVTSGDDIVIRGNNLQSYNAEEGIHGNAAFMFGEDSGAVTNCLVEGNLMNGGNYTVNGGGSGTKGAACHFRENTFQEDYRYGISGNLGPNVVWEESNTLLGTFDPVK